MAKVITYDGSPADRDLCRNIKGDYYLIGNSKIKDSGQCYLLNYNGKEQYCRINSGILCWDYEKEEYTIINDSLAQGYVPGGGEGYFTPNKFKNVYVRSYPFYRSVNTARETTKICFDEDTAILLGGNLSTVDGYWYIGENNQQRLNNHDNFYGKVGYSTFLNVYNLSDANHFNEMVALFKDYNPKITFPVSELYKYFNNYSFGAEIETSSGRVQDKDLWNTFFIPLRDGSISNHEYTSIPLYEEKGLHAFIEGTKLFQKTCRSNQHCSLHFHIGNVLEQSDNPKLLMITIYLLYYLLQKEIWQIIPPYKKSLEYLRTKRELKDHCADIESLGLFDYNIFNHDNSINEKELDKAFNLFFRFWNDGYKADDKYNYNTRKHVKHGGNKWDIKSRYHNINMYNALFSKSNTIEFRAHGGTTNTDKSLAWLLLCIGMIRYAEQNMIDILRQEIKPSLSKIVQGFRDNFGKEDVDPEYGQFVVEYLEAYIYARKEEHVELYLSNDIYGQEFNNDQSYKFLHKGMNLYEWK